MIKIFTYDMDITFHLNSENFRSNKVFPIIYIDIEVKPWLRYIYHTTFSKDSARWELKRMIYINVWNTL